VSAGQSHAAPNQGAPGPGALADLDVVVVDVETTGFLPAEATIIEIGAVRLSGARVTGEFFSLVNPAAPIPAAITELTGISDAMVRRAPAAASALPAFLAFARGCVLVAHNAPFDLGFLTSGCEASGIAWPPAAVLDTAVLARLLLSPDQVPDCKLSTLAGFFAARVAPCHRALPDAQATADVLLGLLEVPAARGPGQQPGRPWPSRGRLGQPGQRQAAPAAGASADGREARPALYATAAAGARDPGRPRRRPWSPLSS
jgi:DNA polymerase III epsilon subunit family exonuclease